MGVNKNATTNEITGKPGLPKPGYKRSTVPKPTAATANSGRIEANPGLGNDPVERKTNPSAATAATTVAT
jgi:hypothetical protein